MKKESIFVDNYADGVRQCEKKKITLVALHFQSPLKRAFQQFPD